MHHKLKIKEAYYQAKVDGLKLFEIREDDRGFQKGDTVSYKRIIHQGFILEDIYEELSGKWEITYVTGYEQKDNYVVFGEKPLN